MSLYDGREPSTSDYDAASTQIGADHLTISSRDRIWQEKGWDVSAGVIVIVGVYETEPTNFTIVVTKKPEAGSPIDNMKVLRLSEIEGPEIELFEADVTNST